MRNRACGGRNFRDVAVAVSGLSGFVVLVIRHRNSGCLGRVGDLWDNRGRDHVVELDDRHVREASTFPLAAAMVVKSARSAVVGVSIRNEVCASDGNVCCQPRRPARRRDGSDCRRLSYSARGNLDRNPGPPNKASLLAGKAAYRPVRSAHSNPP